MFGCCSPESNLGDFSGLLGNAAHQVAQPATVPAWQALGFPDKASWKAAGGRAALDAGVSLTPGSVFHAPGGLPTLPGSGGGVTGTGVPVGGSGTDAAGAVDPAAAASSGGLLSGIPSTYLLIGAAVVILMVLKK